MAKNIIIYASTHHGNTKKLIDAIAAKHDVELLDATKITEKDLSEYDKIGFASGIYAANYHASIVKFAANNLPKDKKVFFIYTSAMPVDFSKGAAKVVENKNATIVGTYGCRGYNTFGPFKLVGGTSKGHPDDKDIAGVLKFYENL